MGVGVRVACRELTEGVLGRGGRLDLVRVRVRDRVRVRVRVRVSVRVRSTFPILTSGTNSFNTVSMACRLGLRFGCMG